jgi:hypothetical protein
MVLQQVLICSGLAATEPWRRCWKEKMLLFEGLICYVAVTRQWNDTRLRCQQVGRASDLQQTSRSCCVVAG